MTFFATILVPTTLEIGTDFAAETVEADDQHGRCAHSFHGFMTEDVAVY
jgi:hypothetical protein